MIHPDQRTAMEKVKIYHNPRCTKSRATLQLLRERGHDPVVVHYLETPPDRETLKALLAKLGLRARDVIRAKDYAALGLAPTDDEEELLARIAANPTVLQRPIVVCGHKARLGRPPEDVLEIL